MTNADNKAFPGAITLERDVNGILVKVTSTGLTKREYFAVQCSKILNCPTDFVGETERKESYERWAKKSVRMADELLKQLNP